MFILIENILKINDEEKSVDEFPLTLKQALIVGSWQVLALFPACRVLACQLWVA